MNKDIPNQIESGGATKYDDADIPRQVWDEGVFMHFLYAQDLTLDIISNDLKTSVMQPFVTRGTR